MPAIDRDRRCRHRRTVGDGPPVLYREFTGPAGPRPGSRSLKRELLEEQRDFREPRAVHRVADVTTTLLALHQSGRH